MINAIFNHIILPSYTEGMQLYYCSISNALRIPAKLNHEKYVVNDVNNSKWVRVKQWITCFCRASLQVSRSALDCSSSSRQAPKATCQEKQSNLSNLLPVTSQELQALTVHTEINVRRLLSCVCHMLSYFTPGFFQPKIKFDGAMTGNAVLYSLSDVDNIASSCNLSRKFNSCAPLCTVFV